MLLILETGIILKRFYEHLESPAKDGENAATARETPYTEFST